MVQILENHHSAVSFKILMDEKYNILANVPDPDFRTIRRYLVSNILYTDMKKHFECLSIFDLKKTEFQENPDSFCKLNFLLLYIR